MELDDQVCLCFHVSKRKIQNFLRIHQPRVPSQLAECGGAGTGCGWCVPFLKRYFREAQAEQSGGPTDTDTPDELTAADYARQRGRYIRDGKGTPPPGATPPPDIA